MAENSDEEEEERSREVIEHWTRVHGPVAWKVGSAQNTDVAPLPQKSVKRQGQKKVYVKEMN